MDISALATGLAARPPIWPAARPAAGLSTRSDTGFTRRLASALPGFVTFVRLHTRPFLPKDVLCPHVFVVPAVLLPRELIPRLLLCHASSSAILISRFARFALAFAEFSESDSPSFVILDASSWHRWNFLGPGLSWPTWGGSGRPRLRLASLHAQFAFCKFEAYCFQCEDLVDALAILDIQS